MKLFEVFGGADLGGGAREVSESSGGELDFGSFLCLALSGDGWEVVSDGDESFVHLDGGGDGGRCGLAEGYFDGEVGDADDVASGEVCFVYGLVIEVCLVGAVEVLDEPFALGVVDDGVASRDGGGGQEDLAVCVSADVDGAGGEFEFIERLAGFFDYEIHGVLASIITAGVHFGHLILKLLLFGRLRFWRHFGLIDWFCGRLCGACGCLPDGGGDGSCGAGSRQDGNFEVLC